MQVVEERNPKKTGTQERLMKRWKGGVVEGVVRRMTRPKATRKPSL